MEETKVTMSLQSILALLTIIGTIFCSYMVTSNRITTIESQIEHMIEQDKKITPVLERLDRTVLKLSFVVDQMQDKTEVSDDVPPL